MDRSIDQPNIDIDKFLQNPESSLPVFEAELAPTSTPISRAALLHINIAEESIGLAKLEAALEVINKEFSAVTIFIDMRLTLLLYRIILPYMTDEQIQNIAIRRKLDWTAKSMPLIKGLTIPWDIITDTDERLEKNSSVSKLNDLIKADSNFHKSLEADTEAFKKYLSEAHNIDPIQYNENNIKNYLIENLAATEAMGHFDHYDYMYITAYNMRSYDLLQAKGTLPQHLQISFTQTARGNEQLTSTDLNQKLHDSNLLGKISARKSYLEKSIKHFPGHVYVKSLNRTFLAFNKEPCLSVGLEDNAYIKGKKFDSIFSKEDSDKVADIAKEISTTNEAKVLIENHYYPAAREELTFLSIKMPLRNNKNKTIGIIGFSLMLEDTKATKELKKTKPTNVMNKIIENTEDKKAPTGRFTANLKKTLEKMPGHVFWQDREGKILGANDSHAAFLGLSSPSELVGKEQSAILAKKDLVEAKEHLEKIFATGKPIVKQEAYISGDKQVEMMSHKTPIKDDNGNVTGVMVMAAEIYQSNKRDINLERKKEQLEISNNIKNQCIDVIERDMRAPIIGLYNMAKLCAQKETDIKKKRQLYEISNCAKNLLTFSSNITKANYKNLISIKNLTNTVISANITAIQSKRLKFELDYDTSIPDTLVGNSYKLEKTVNNLIDNAIKHSKYGHVTLVTKLESSKGSDLVISFSAIDSKAGVSEEEQQYIFSKYETVDYMKHGAKNG